MRGRERRRGGGQRWCAPATAGEKQYSYVATALVLICARRLVTSHYALYRPAKPAPKPEPSNSMSEQELETRLEYVVESSICHLNCTIPIHSPSLPEYSMLLRRCCCCDDRVLGKREREGARVNCVCVCDGEKGRESVCVRERACGRAGVAEKFAFKYLC